MILWHIAWDDQNFQVLWRWSELKSFAANESLAWPLRATKEDEFKHFAAIYNATGTRQVANGAPKGAGPALAWLRECVLDKCPSGGGGPDVALYAPVVLDECSSSTNPACELATAWTAITSTTPSGVNATIFRNGLSLPEIPHHRYATCYALNVPPTEVLGHDQVVAYGDHTGKCAKDAKENMFHLQSGMLATTIGYTTEDCKAEGGCCMQADAAGSLVMAACDSTNPLQQFEVERLDGKPGQIKDKATGRCLQTKGCAKPQL